MSSGWPPSTIALHGLGRGAIHWETDLPATAPVWTGTGLRFARSPRVAVEVERAADGGVHVRGTVTAAIRQACRRCLREMVDAVRAPLDLWFDPAVQPGSEAEGVFALPDGAAAIDLGPVVREELILALTEYPLCRVDCRGLCSGCGADLNETTCSCSPKAADPRWDALRELRGKVEQVARRTDQNRAERT